MAEDVRLDRESTKTIAKVLTAEQKRILFDVAGQRPEWMVAHCASVLAVSTTSRGIELKHLHWRDVDRLAQETSIRRSKTEAGHRKIPMNSDAMTAVAWLWDRAEKLGCCQPDHFVFPSCQRHQIDPTRPQKTWRTAWRSIVKEAAEQAGDAAVEAAVKNGTDPTEARRKASEPFLGLRFHDLRHQAITELGETGTPDATVMAVAGHLSRAMMEHYSHVRMANKRAALAKLESGLIRPLEDSEEDVAKSCGRRLRHNPRHKGRLVK